MVEPLGLSITVSDKFRRWHPVGLLLKCVVENLNLPHIKLEQDRDFALRANIYHVVQELENG